MPVNPRRQKLGWAILGLLWLGQLAYLSWHFAPETVTLARDLAAGRWGEALRRQDPLAREAEKLAAVLPPTAAYLFLDYYEAARDIKIRYLLYPRRQVRLEPRVTPTRLYAEIRRQQAEYLVLPRQVVFLGLDFLFQAEPEPFRPLTGDFDALVFQVEPQRLQGDFYD